MSSSSSLPPGLTSALQSAELWPIQAKGAVQRLNPLGDPTIEKFYHESMEQGRFLEKDIADAQHWLAQLQKDLMQKILIHTRVNSLAVDGQLSNPARAIKFVADSIIIITDIIKFVEEIVGLIAAVEQNIAILLQIELNMLNMVTANLRALANLLQQICNWHLPTLPSLPNLLKDSIWHWNGVQFAPLASFEQLLSRLENLGSTNINAINSALAAFSFSQCTIQPTNTGTSLTSQPAPANITTYSGLNLGTTLIAPPLSGTISPAGQDLTDPSYVTTMQQTTTSPVYLSPSDSPYNEATPFNPNSSMLGSLPDPSTIISNYQMPAETYQNNIVCVVPQTRYVTDDLGLQKALTEYITLAEIVASNFDPNITAEWLFYLNFNRVGRAGQWLTNFQAAYISYILPSLNYLASNPVPWNCALPSIVVNDAPTAIPLLVTLTRDNTQSRGALLWMLSYLEAALLGYTRNTTWDVYASGNYVSGFTGTDLDYRATAIDTTVTTTIILGEGTAKYPVSCTFPSAIGSVLQEVIAIATINIQNTPSYTTNRPQYKFIYDQFAVSTEVDRFTQFWRTFNANLQTLLLQDPYLVQFVVSYSASLDSAIDPLGSSTIYNQIQTDAATRNRSWVPGSALPEIPEIPNVSYTSTGIVGAQNGWAGTTFNPAVYLSRPDIQQLPIPTQLAMLRTNISYAAVLQNASAVSTAIQNSIQNSQSIAQSFQNLGFKAETTSSFNVPVGTTGLQVSFNQTDYDYTGNVTSANTFTIQTAGNYAMLVALAWGSGSAGVRTGTVFVNGTAIGTASTSDTQDGPTTLQLALNPYFNQDDVVTVVATHNLATIQTVGAGSYISAMYTDATAPSVSGGVPSSTGLSATRTFTADAAITSLTAVVVDSYGNVTAVDPTTVQTVSGDPVYPIVTGVALSSSAAGENVTVATYYGGVYEYDGANFTVGGLLYAGVGGILSQDYATIIATCSWIVVVGRAISPSQFIFEPHIPNLTNLGNF